ncbi:MAG: dTDP-4-dehydrorhamnose reductase [Patescibacteria group bacterium]
MKKILIIGARGMLGQELMKVFGTDKNYEVVGTDMKDFDITNKEKVFENIKNIAPQIVINAAAFTRVDDCEKPEFKDICMKVNGYAVGYIAAVCRELNAVMIHYSTDYIFFGEKERGYREDEKDFAPLNIYGQSKLLGEQELLKNTDRFYLIRTAWLYGKNGKNFVDTMLELAHKMPELKVVNDQTGSPTYAVDLAKRTKEILEGNYPFGVYHITNEGTVSWYDFAKKIFEIAKIDVKVIPVASNEFPRPAKRPKYSVLVNTKLPKSRKWEEALEEYLLKKI